MIHFSPHFGGKKGRENCTIDPCGWPKVQIAHSAIKINSEIYVIDLIFKLFHRVKGFDSYTTPSQQPLTSGWASVCGVHPHVKGCCVVVVLVL
jgi:hypothetical protein